VTAPADEAPADGRVLSFRRPTEADHRTVVRVVDDWWDGRAIHVILPRLWFQHFAGTSWLAEDERGRLAGFLVGFISPDRPDVAYCHMVGVDPNLRHVGLGRRLYERFFEDARAAGAQVVHAITWPGNRTSVAFHRSLGFRPEEGPGTQNLYGTPAVADYDYDTEDRVVFTREL
jgi:ribosomal protein S18 acetylase RimI-like enzyme